MGRGVSIFSILFLFNLITGCVEEGAVIDAANPDLTGTPITDVTDVSAKSGGFVISDRGSSILARGICWSTESDPTIDDSKTIDGAGTGEYESMLTGLAPETEYWARAYATNKVGTTYGKTFTFVTQRTGDKFAGEFEIIEGSIIRNTPTGPDPVYSGDYITGLSMWVQIIDDHTVSIQPMFKEGTSISMNIVYLVIDEITLQVTVLLNNMIINTPGLENSFTPGSAGTKDMYTLNFQWEASSGTRVISGLKLLRD